jgi:hypothetical protein
VVEPSFLHVGGFSCCLVAAMSCADFRGRIDGAKYQRMTSVGEVTEEEGREFFLCTEQELNRRPLPFEKRMVPQDHCQCTLCLLLQREKVQIGLGKKIEIKGGQLRAPKWNVTCRNRRRIFFMMQEEQLKVGTNRAGSFMGKSPAVDYLPQMFKRRKSRF